MEAACSSETSVLTRVTRHRIQADNILNSHCRDNFKFYTLFNLLNARKISNVNPSKSCRYPKIDSVKHILEFVISVDLTAVIEMQLRAVW
jgi:hypothetical protein